MTQLAQRTGAVNLGQGFPDDDGPMPVLHAARDALLDGCNQYPPSHGVPALREAIAAHQNRFYDLGVRTEDVMVTMGATEAIAAAVLAFVRPGDEVVMFEPYYDSYAAMVELAGGVRRTVPLRFPDFAVDPEALRAAFSERTALVLINTPHNPTGKVFTAEELTLIGEVAEEFDAVVFSDEVYEHLAYDQRRHLPAASMSALSDRTVTASSTGKTFNLTGWKVGWVHGPNDLVTAMSKVKQFLTFAGAAPLQPAVASALALDDSFFETLTAEMERRRDLLIDGLNRAGFTTTVPEGGYFVLADAAPLGATDGSSFCLELPQTAGVVAIPAQVFCDDPDACGMRTVIRFAFCKSTATIEAALERLIHTFGADSGSSDAS